MLRLCATHGLKKDLPNWVWGLIFSLVADIGVQTTKAPHPSTVSASSTPMYQLRYVGMFTPFSYIFQVLFVLSNMFGIFEFGIAINTVKCIRGKEERKNLSILILYPLKEVCYFASVFSYKI